MSTNEEREINEENIQHDQQKLETSKFLEKPCLNSTQASTEETFSKKDNVTVSVNNQRACEQEKSVESQESVQPEIKSDISSREYENQVLTQVLTLLSTKAPDLDFETELEEQETESEMSRSNVKVKTPNKTSSRPNLPHVTPKLTGELTGQPSVRNAKDDAKYWKNREQELLDKIAVLESRIGGASKPKFYGPVDQVAAQRQEKLEEDLSQTAREKENYKNRLQMIEKELIAKQNEQFKEVNIKNMKNAEEVMLQLKEQNEDLRTALAKMTAILRDKTGLCMSQEKKVTALTNQVDSLKEVVAITKDLLNIRNMEVQHLSNDISAMESKIDCERQRHNQMLVKMDEAVKLNSELKKEYENQLKIFQHLRDTYEEKVRILSRESLTMDGDQVADIKRVASANEGGKRSPTSTPSRMSSTRVSNYKVSFPDN